MSDINNAGGPAFPVLTYEYKGTGDLHPSPTIEYGMTLRDWFAGQALIGYLSKGGSMPEVIEYAYRAADAMLEARKEPKP